MTESKVEDEGVLEMALLDARGVWSDGDQTNFPLFAIARNGKAWSVSLRLGIDLARFWELRAQRGEFEDALVRAACDLGPTFAFGSEAVVTAEAKLNALAAKALSEDEAAGR